MLCTQFKFKHNVVERSIYAEGTVDAVLFLAKKRSEGAEKKVYNMVGLSCPEDSLCLGTLFPLLVRLAVTECRCLGWDPC